MIKSPESIAIEIVRMINMAAARKDIKRIDVFASLEVAEFLQNQRRGVIAGIESDEEKQIIIKADESCFGGESRIVCYDERESVVKF